MTLLERNASQKGQLASQTMTMLGELLAELASHDYLGRVRGVNDFVNGRILFESDDVVWGQRDYWASPLETLARGRGDCEDFAITKYFALVAAGVPAAALRLVYARARIGGSRGPQQAHMVLAYYPQADAEPLILDNLISDLRPASGRPDLEPVFSFNTDGLWQGTGTAAVGGDPLARVAQWRQVLKKARAEGFL